MGENEVVAEALALGYKDTLPLMSEPEHRTTLHLTIKGQPRPKTRPQVRRNGQVFTRSSKVEQAIGWAWREEWGNRRFVGPVSIRLEFYRRDRRRVDWDNLAKLVLDGLNNVAYDDDSQVRKSEVSVDYDPAHPRSEIWLTGELA